jgi:hypothetical protein
MKRLHFLFFAVILCFIFPEFYIHHEAIHMSHEGGWIVFSFLLFRAMEWNGFDCIESKRTGRWAKAFVSTTYKRSGAKYYYWNPLEHQITPIFHLHSFSFFSLARLVLAQLRKVPRRSLCARETRPNARHFLHPNRLLEMLTQRPHCPSHSFLYDSCKLRCNLSNPDLQPHSLP